MTENNTIIDTSDLAGDAGSGSPESVDFRTDMVATKNPDGVGIEFNISMRDYTMRDMEALIVEAAAMQIVGRIGAGRLAKAIEAKCIELIETKANAALEGVTSEIIDQPLIPSFGDKKPVTMREFIGLTGREYLTERVDRDGRLLADSGWGRSSSMTRAEYMVITLLGAKFKKEIEATTSAVLSALGKEFRAAHETALAEQKARVRDALASLTK